MLWFRGPIAEAVAATKRENKTLLVFVTNSTVESFDLMEYFDSNPQLAVLLAASGDFICLKLEHGMTPASQFAAVFPYEEVPSVHLISSNGKRTRYRGNFASSEELSSFIQEDRPTKSGQNMEERAQLAKERLLAKHQTKEKLKENESLKEELKRRQLGEDTQDVRESQRDREIRERVQQQRLDRVRDRERSEQIKRQIEEDKRDSMLRRKIIQTNDYDASEEDIKEVHMRNIFIPKVNPSAAQISRNVPTKLQFKLSSGIGGQATKIFPATATLAQEVRAWLKELTTEQLIQNRDGESVSPIFPLHLVNSIGNGYSFSLLRPPKKFSDFEELQTLAQLGLSPSASLIITGKEGRVVTQSQGLSGGLINSVTGIVNAMVGTAWGIGSGFIRGIFSFFTASAPATERGQQTQQQNQQSRASTSSAKDNTKNPRVITQGKINRLSHRPESADDEQARWNGNSTSQL